MHITQDYTGENGTREFGSFNFDRGYYEVEFIKNA